MRIDLERARREANWARYRPGQLQGHYESWFQRANHPTRPLAFWIRYTLFSPARRPGEAMGELWAIFFDGENGHHVAVKEELSLERCAFARDRFEVVIGDARLDGQGLHGAAASGGHRVSWRLDSSSGGAAPLFFHPLAYYERSFPRAKVLVGVPDALYRGSIELDGRKIEIDGWRGTQNHNWGERHTDLYAWGQVVGFDEAPDSYLEVATARVKLGPLWTPLMTPLVLRHRGEELALNSAPRMLRARGGFRYFDWRFRSENDAVRIEGRIHAPASAFVALTYGNPPGGTRRCLNSKLAACELHITRRADNGRTERLSTAHRAAFELLTEERGQTHEREGDLIERAGWTAVESSAHP